MHTYLYTEQKPKTLQTIIIITVWLETRQYEICKIRGSIYLLRIHHVGKSNSQLNNFYVCCQKFCEKHYTKKNNNSNEHITQNTTCSYCCLHLS